VITLSKHFNILSGQCRIISLLTVSQSHMALSPYLGLVAIFLLYNRKFWFCMSWDALPNGWAGLSVKDHSPYLYYKYVCKLSFYMHAYIHTYIHTYTHTHSLITNDVSDYINLLVRIAQIICNHCLYMIFAFAKFLYAYASPVSPGTVRQIMPISCTYGSLAT